MFTPHDIERVLERVLSGAPAIQQQFADILKQVNAERVNFDRPVGEMDGAECLRERAEIAREVKMVKARMKKLESRVKLLDPAIEEYAQLGELDPPFRVAGCTISFTHRLWAKVNRAGEEATDEEKAAAIKALDGAGLGKQYAPRSVQVQSLSAHFKAELDEGRFVFPDGEDGLPVNEVHLFGGAILVTKKPAVSVRVS